MPLYTCPGCEKPIAESQPLDHCLQCDAMNERQRARNRPRSSSVSEGTETVVECTIITVILRRPSQQYGNGPAHTRATASPPSYEEVFPWEPETSVVENRPQQQQQQQQQQATNSTPQQRATATIPIHIKRV